MTETQRRIKELKRSLPNMKEKVVAVAVLLALSLTMMASVSYAWYTLSFAPEVNNISTTIVGNGNLEIALSGPDGKAPSSSQVGDSFSATGQSVVNANLTWGNLLNLGGAYGIEEIVLRPATFDPSSKFYLSSVSYDEGGRVDDDAVTDFAFTSWVQTSAEMGTHEFQVIKGSAFGVRAISSVGYGEGGKTVLQMKLEEAQARGAKSTGAYDDIMSNDDYITTLRDIVQIYLYAEMYETLSGSDDWKYQAAASAIKNKSSDVLSKDQIGALVGIYEELSDTVDYLGEAIVYLANIHQYLHHGDENAYTPYSAETFFEYTEQKLNEDGVKLSYSDLILPYITLKTRVDGDCATLQDYYNRALDGEKIHLRDTAMLAIVNNLIDIDTVKVDSRKGIAQTVGYLVDHMGVALNLINSLSSGDTVDVIAQNGDLKAYEDLTGARMDVTLRKLELVLVSNINGHMTTNATKNAYTSAITETMNRDSSLTANMVAKDTYGMVIDLWLRTNADHSILTLDGLVSSRTDYVPSKVVLSGEANARDAYVYKRPTTVAINEGTYATEDVIVYREETGEGENKVAYYYSTESRSQMYLEELATVDVVDKDGNPVKDEDGKQVTTLEVRPKLDKDGNPVPLTDAHLEEGVVLQRKYDPVVTVTGFKGSNRVYEDLYVESGEISATQGSGSCFIFYPNSPEESDSTLELLKFLKVAFVDAESNLLAEAIFDVEHVFADSGKYIVPLVITSGDYSFQDAEGNTCYGITMLEKNVATRISAVVYLEGKGLENSMAMSDSITQGSLNLQFATDEQYKPLEDSDLQMQTIALSANLNKTSYDYGDSNADKRVTLQATIEGLSISENTSVQAIFQRKINASQGSRMAAIDLDLVSGSVWSADFSFNMPGTYVLSSLWINGVEYPLPQILTLTVTGFELKSVTFCESLQEKLALTAENSVSREVRVAFNSAWEPDYVAARIVSNDGVYISVPLTYDRTTKDWVGTGRFTSSGTYTIKYLLLSGEMLNEETGKEEPYELYYELDPDDQTSLTAYLGLTVRVLLDDSKSDLNFIYESGESRAVAIKAEILTNTGTPMLALEDVHLYYGARGSSILSNGLYAELEWNDGFYTGTFNVDKDGSFSFAQLKVGSNLIKVAVSAPVINARDISPIRYDHETGSRAEGLIVDANSGVPSYIATIRNAKTANVTAVIVDPEGDEYHVVGELEGTETFRFVMPRNADRVNGFSGTWIVKEIRADGVYDINGYYYGSDDSSARAEYYTIKPETGATSVYSFQVLDGNAISVSVVGTTVGLGADGKTPEAPFMSAQNFGTVTTNNADGTYSYDGIQLSVSGLAGVDNAKVTGMKLLLQYENGTSPAFGSYSITNGTPSNQSFTLDLVDPEEDGVWTIAANDAVAVAYLAGKYDGTLTITVNNQYTYKYSYGGADGTTKVEALNDVLKVYSAKPKVKVDSITGTGEIHVYTGEDAEGTRLVGNFANKSDYSATVYIYHGTSWKYNYYKPSVTLKLYDMPDVAYTATMVFQNNLATTTFSFSNTSVTSTNEIGGTDGGVTPHGLRSASSVTVTIGTVTYAVELEQKVTINNPKYPPHLIYSISGSGFTGTVPATQISPDGNAFVVKLPSDIQNWTNTTSSESQGPRTYTVGSADAGAKLGTVSYQPPSCIGQGYHVYTRYQKQYVVDITTTTTVTTYAVTGWKIGDRTYALGEEVIITSGETATAVISPVGTVNTPVTETYLVTEYYDDQDQKDSNKVVGTEVDTVYTEGFTVVSRVKQ